MYKLPIRPFKEPSHPPISGRITVFVAKIPWQVRGGRKPSVNQQINNLICANFWCQLQLHQKTETETAAATRKPMPASRMKSRGSGAGARVVTASVTRRGKPCHRESRTSTTTTTSASTILVCTACCILSGTLFACFCKIYACLFTHVVALAKKRPYTRPFWNYFSINATLQYCVSCSSDKFGRGRRGYMLFRGQLQPFFWVYRATAHTVSPFHLHLLAAWRPADDCRRFN